MIKAIIQSDCSLNLISIKTQDYKNCLQYLWVYYIIHLKLGVFLSSRNSMAAFEFRYYSFIKSIGFVNGRNSRESFIKSFHLWTINKDEQVNK
jgi:hypothetical protein